MLRMLVIAMAAGCCLAGAQTAAAAAPVITVTSGPANLALTSFVTRDSVVDTTPPETTITQGPPDGAVINDDAPMFAWASSEVGSTFTCTADGVLLASCDLLFATGASPGRHSFTVAATDLAGNVDPTPATRAFTVSLAAAPQDLPRCPLEGNIIVATSNDDTRVGTAATDIIYGRDGDDLLRGGGGADCVTGESGDDRLFGGAGNDLVFGGPGTDRLAGETGNDELFGDAGSDRLTGGSGRDVLDGGAGADSLSDASGRDSLIGGTGNDRINSRDTSRLGRRIADSVRCGAGRFDVALVDRLDRVARDCERVSRR